MNYADSSRKNHTEIERSALFMGYVWTFVGGSTKQNRWKVPREVPASTRQSDMLSKDLQRRGFKFVAKT
ncbi:MAG TPA: DNA-3-methyladenine glycosylase I [Terriglobia bacterium]|nr:DNA-3-methyladenine glycosylase I [Terriglobia bacterium]